MLRSPLPDATLPFVEAPHATRAGCAILQELCAHLASPCPAGEEVSFVAAGAALAEEFDAFSRRGYWGPAAAADKAQYDDMRHDAANVVGAVANACDPERNLDAPARARKLTAESLRQYVERSVMDNLLPLEPVVLAGPEAVGMALGFLRAHGNGPLPHVDAVDSGAGAVSVVPRHLAAMSKEIMRNCRKYGVPGTASVVTSSMDDALCVTVTNRIDPNPKADFSSRKGSVLVGEFARLMGARAEMRKQGSIWAAEILLPYVDVPSR